MNMEWLITNVRAAYPSSEQKVSFLGNFWRFFDNWGHFCGQGANLWGDITLMCPKKHTQGHSMKPEWLVTNVTAVWFWMFFGQLRQLLWSVSRFDLEIASWVLKTLLRSYNEKEWLIVNVQLSDPLPEQKVNLFGVFLMFFVEKSHRCYFYHCCFYTAAILTVVAQNPYLGVTSKPATVAPQLFYTNYFDLIIIVHRGSK